MIAPSPSASPHRILPWLARRGAVLAPLSISPDPAAGRTVVAAAPIDDGALVLSIPLPLLVTTAAARASAAGRALAGSDVPPGNHTFLAAFLLAERAKARSRFRSYLDSLPAAFPTLPIFWPPEDLALLEGSAAIEKVAARRVTLTRDHRVLCHAVPAFRGLPYADFVWARSCVLTRVFGLTIAGAKTEALVPLADMLNHAHPEETRWAYDDGAGAFVMTALRAFQAGDPVHDSYGRKSNTRFLVNYGFTLDGNDDDDEAAVRLAIPPDAPLAAEKARLLEVRPGAPSSLTLPAEARDAASGEALSFLRVACATPGEFEQIAFAPPDVRRVLPLNGRNETAALGVLAAACEEALAAFPTTADQDDALLADAALSPNARNAVIARRGEKRVLSRWIALARAAVPFLRLPRPSIARAVDEGAAGDGDARRYLARFVATAGRGRRPAPPLDGRGRIY